MCRLIAIIGKSENTKLLLERFQALAHNGQVPGASPGFKDGWGIVGYQKGKIIVYEKDPQNAFQNKKYIGVVSKILNAETDVTIGHLRKASVGENKMENTHPFIFKNISLAQNGTVFQGETALLQPKFAKQVCGTSDSERLFYLILQNANKLTSKDIHKSIIRSVKIIRQEFDYTAINLLISDGIKLWAIREVNEKNKLVKEKKMIQYFSLFFGIEKKSGSVVVASEKIKAAGIRWKLLKNHRMVEIIVADKRVYSLDI